MSVNIVNTSGINGPATDFSSITAVINVNISGNYAPISGSSGGGGTGDVVGPGSSTDNAITRFDGVTGKLIQNSSVILDDTGNITLPSGQFLYVNNGGVSTPLSNQDININASKGFLSNSSNLHFNIGASTFLDVTDASGVTFNYSPGGYTSKAVLQGSSVFLQQGGPGGSSSINLTGGTLAIDAPLVSTVSGTQSVGTAAIPFSVVQSKQYGTPLINKPILTNSAAIDWSNGASQKLDFTNGISGTVIVSMTNPLIGSSYILTTKQNVSGTTAVQWPNTILWQNQVSGATTATSGTSDLFTFYYDGTNYFGNTSNNYR